MTLERDFDDFKLGGTGRDLDLDNLTEFVTEQTLCYRGRLRKFLLAEIGRTRQTLWSAVQMLTQKLCCQTIHDCPKVVPLHYESE